eukprot:TRINITY_DN4138_c0_g1_i2.p1 TRINITY_DN4138_c0_g1~~TRINITY_DN4138_c0_g1_i2.p1  ORF type:complete len:252 (-),score=50.55 TRINITY_DN4138_c0_g1_i2:25-780(-)
MVSPVDGVLLHSGVVSKENSLMEQIRGIPFNLIDLVGPSSKLLPAVYRPSKKGNNLHYCILYVGKKDYHRMHAPSNVILQERSYFPGYHFPIDAEDIGKMQSLFALNEHVVFTGLWEEGFFSIIPVEGFLTGSLNTEFDQLTTNNLTDRIGEQKTVSYPVPIVAERGEELGSLGLGSVVIMVFESNPIKYLVEPGKKVKMGEPLFRPMTEEDRKAQQKKETRIEERQKVDRQKLYRDTKSTLEVMREKSPN